MRRIYLIGFMGSGKTTLGRLLAKTLKTEFIDLDEWIELKEKRSIATVFQTDGEAYFRDLEYKALKTIKSETVIATGGGIIVEDQNRELLASRGTVFYLHTPLETQVERTAKDKDRPLLKDQDPRKILKRLQEDRQTQYEEVADHIINTENKSGSEVANEIVKLVKNYG